MLWTTGTAVCLDEGIFASHPPPASNIWRNNVVKWGESQPNPPPEWLPSTLFPVALPLHPFPVLQVNMSSRLLQSGEGCAASRREGLPSSNLWALQPSTAGKLLCLAPLALADIWGFLCLPFSPLQVMGLTRPGIPLGGIEASLGLIRWDDLSRPFSWGGRLVGRDSWGRHQGKLS